MVIEDRHRSRRRLNSRALNLHACPTTSTLSRQKLSRGTLPRRHHLRRDPVILQLPGQDLGPQTAACAQSDGS